MSFRKIVSILNCSRIYSLPMTIMSWLVIFIYTATSSGNKLLGFISLFGIAFAHLGTNVLDDYFDYKFLIKQTNFDKKEYLKNSQATKCRYIISGELKEKEVLFVALGYLGIAGVIGLILYFLCGRGVIYYTLGASFFILLYPFLSRIRLSEFAIGITYGPILFGGVYYVMTKTYSWDIFILSIPTMIVTVILLYIHSVMDFDFDLNENHNTIANSFDSQLDSLIVLKILLILSYISPIILCIFDILDWQVFLVCLTIPLAIDLFYAMYDFSINSNSIPKHKWYHFPMENLKYMRTIEEKAFMFRMLLSRNLMIYYSILLVIAILLGIN